MGAEQSTLTKNGYVVEENSSTTENTVVATKGDEKFLIKKMDLCKMPRDDVPAFTEEIEILKTISHPHIVNCKNSFRDQNIYYIVMDHCQGGNLAAKIRDMNSESQVLNWIVEICLALKVFHEKGLVHKHLTPESIFLTEFGIVHLGDFGEIHKNSKSQFQSTTTSHHLEINYLPPEVFTDGTNNAKSDIWSVGCILYELLTRKPAFSAENAVRFMPKITGGHYPSLPEKFSPELRQLLSDIFSRDPQSRPTASEILERPFIISFLLHKSKTTVRRLQENLDNLRLVADDLERVHQGATIGSLTGGVIGAMGGMTSIVGLILAPFTLGASLIVTGVGVGVSVLGGATAGASNITKMVNQSSDRKAIRSIFKEFQQKIEAVLTWLQEISNILQTTRSRYESANTMGNTVQNEDLLRLGMRARRGISGIAELVRLVQVMNIGNVAVSTSDQNTLLPSSLMQGLESDTSEARDQPSPDTSPVRSEIMKFVRSIRQAADNLQGVLDEFKSIISSIHPIRVEGEPDWQEMELM